MVTSGYGAPPGAGGDELLHMAGNRTAVTYGEQHPIGCVRMTGDVRLLSRRG